MARYPGRQGSIRSRLGPVAGAAVRLTAASRLSDKRRRGTGYWSVDRQGSRQRRSHRLDSVLEEVGELILPGSNMEPFKDPIDNSGSLIVH